MYPFGQLVTRDLEIRRLGIRRKEIRDAVANPIPESVPERLAGL